MHFDWDVLNDVAKLNTLIGSAGFWPVYIKDLLECCFICLVIDCSVGKNQNVCIICL